MDQKQESEKRIIGNCLSCHGLVRVPATAPANSTVRCPHCTSSFHLSQILDQAVPELEVVKESDTQPDIPRVDQILSKNKSAGEGGQKFVVPSQLSKGAIRHRRRSGNSTGHSTGQSTGHSSGDEMDFDDLKLTETESISRSSESNSSGSKSSGSGRSRGNQGSRRDTKSSSRRRRSTHRNSNTEMLKVVIGGLLAIPIAYLLVFWIFRQDPLRLAPVISRIAPVLVPAELRTKELPALPGPSLDVDDSTGDEPKSSVPVLDVDPDRVD